MAKPTDRSELKDGARLVRQVLKSIPAELDESEDAVLRKLVGGAAKAADAASKEAPSGEPSAE